jgi:hypothetical protein
MFLVAVTQGTAAASLGLRVISRQERNPVPPILSTRESEVRVDPAAV